MNGRSREQAGFLLHRRRYRETSALVDILLRDHGRMTFIAKGAFRPKSPLHGALQAFVPLSVSGRGKGELQTLIAAEPIAAGYDLSGRRLYCGLYLNELLTRMTARADPHPGLFDDYAQALAGLAWGANEEFALRLFEKHLLEAVGYGLALTHESHTGEVLRPDRQYTYVLEQGPVKHSGPHPLGGIPLLSGGTLLALGAEEPLDSRQSSEAKVLMRYVLGHFLGKKPLLSRSLFAKSG